MEWCLKLPWPPSLNHYKKIGRLVTTKNGKVYQQRANTDETKTFYYKTYIVSKENMPPEWPKFRDREDIKYQVRVSLHPPNKCRYDIDNRLKVLFDGLMHAKIINDDAQIHRLFVEKLNMIDEGMVIVRIQEML